VFDPALTMLAKAVTATPIVVVRAFGATAAKMVVGCAGVTVAVALLVWVPTFVSVLANVMVAVCIPTGNPWVLAFGAKVMVLPEVDALPDVADAVNQDGTPEIE
jgi:hypothetical protein